MKANQYGKLLGKGNKRLYKSVMSDGKESCKCKIY